MSESTVSDRADDDSDIGWGERSAYDDETRLLDERPPHHEERA